MAIKTLLSLKRIVDSAERMTKAAKEDVKKADDVLTSAATALKEATTRVEEAKKELGELERGTPEYKAQQKRLVDAESELLKAQATHSKAEDSREAALAKAQDASDAATKASRDYEAGKKSRIEKVLGGADDEAGSISRADKIKKMSAAEQIGALTLRSEAAHEAMYAHTKNADKNNKPASLGSQIIDVQMSATLLDDSLFKLFEIANFQGKSDDEAEAKYASEKESRDRKRDEVTANNEKAMAQLIKDFADTFEEEIMKQFVRLQEKGGEGAEGLTWDLGESDQYMGPGPGASVVASTVYNANFTEAKIAPLEKMISKAEARIKYLEDKLVREEAIKDKATKAGDEPTQKKAEHNITALKDAIKDVKNQKSDLESDHDEKKADFSEKNDYVQEFFAGFETWKAAEDNGNQKKFPGEDWANDPEVNNVKVAFLPIENMWKPGNGESTIMMMGNSADANKFIKDSAGLYEFDANLYGSAVVEATKYIADKNDADEEKTQLSTVKDELLKSLSIAGEELKERMAIYEVSSVIPEAKMAKSLSQNNVDTILKVTAAIKKATDSGKFSCTVEAPFPVTVWEMLTQKGYEVTEVVDSKDHASGKVEGKVVDGQFVSELDIAYKINWAVADSDHGNAKDWSWADDADNLKAMVTLNKKSREAGMA